MLISIVCMCDFVCICLRENGRECMFWIMYKVSLSLSLTSWHSWLLLSSYWPTHALYPDNCFREWNFFIFKKLKHVLNYNKSTHTLTHTTLSERQHPSNPALLFLISWVSQEKSACQRLCPNNEKSVWKKNQPKNKYFSITVHQSI